MAQLGAAEIAMMTRDLDDSQKTIFQSQYSSEKKDRGTATILAFLCWDRIWFGDLGLGILKLITWGLCGIWWLIDIFTAGSRCDEYNRQKAQEIVTALKLTQGPPSIQFEQQTVASTPAKDLVTLTRPNSQQKVSTTSKFSGVTATKWFISGLSGPLNDRDVELTAAPLIIGRDPEQSNLIIPLPNQIISKKHCSIRFDDERGNILIEDLGSKNGTFFYGGKRLDAGRSYILENGDRFYLAEPDILFELQAK
ncbi:MAG: FHA domain-containing protein [Desulfotomaculaceae bacterium]|nr:FHA domain-containing protein [Desulfotomaculaceae bacterium]